MIATLSVTVVQVLSISGVVIAALITAAVILFDKPGRGP